MAELADPATVALRGCRLFADLDASALERLASTARRRRYRRNEAIFHQDDPGDALFVVTDGAVKIEIPSAGGDEAAILASVGPGESFGELALLDGAPRSADAVAIEATELLVVRRDAFLALVDADAGLRRALLTALAGELRRLTGQVADLHFLDLPGRLARYLVRLADGVEPDADGSVRIPWRFTQSELAGMLGGSRQSVNRLLGDLERRGIVRAERDELTILDPVALAAEVKS
jgi:CRP/FNR family transcriptional regulator/CRP/FNR family cyclic AMP-dependent transcriptional regulator